MPRKRTGGIEEVDGRRYARVTVVLADGRKVRRRVRIDATITKKEAKTEAKKLSKEAEGYIFDPKKKTPPRLLAGVQSPTVDEFHADWATDRERRGRVSERGRYEKHIHPVFGGLRMRAITKDHARQLSAELDDKVLAKELHWSTATKVWGVATKMFRDSVESKVAALRVLETNPFQGVKGPERGVRKGKQWLYPTEAIQLLACPEVPLRWRELYALMMYLYTRPEELAALECSDVNLEHGYVHVHRAIDLRSAHVKPTKTKRTRKVPIKLAIRPLLTRLVKSAGKTGPLIRFEHANKKQKHGLPPVEDLAATLRRHLERAKVDRVDLHRKTEGTKRITFYDLRATGITWEALAKTEMLTIMQRAGHDEPKTTLGYIREAEAVGYDAGVPFPPLPESLEKASGKGLSGGTVSQPTETVKETSVPNGIRTRVTALKGPCPGPG
jgi:integrase